MLIFKTPSARRRLFSLFELKQNCVLTAAFLIALGAASFAVAETGDELDSEFARELKLVEGLKVYNQQLQEQLTVQSEAAGSIRQSIDAAAELGPQIAPLLERMITALDQFIDADLPFHLDERKQSVSKLKQLLVEPGVTDSERYRQVLDIYTVETEYGQSFEAYASELDGQPVDVLRIGRLALFAQTRDQGQSFIYDKTAGQWQALAEEHGRNIRKAIKVAAKTVAPELLSLPIAAPSGS